MAGKVRVLVADDSAFARKVVRESLSAHPDIEVVGIAHDGLEALELVNQLHPDVMTLDLMMPNLDGLGVLRALPKESPPRVVVVSMAEEDSELAVTALQLGAFELVHKPTALATDRLYELADELVEKVLAAATARPVAPHALIPPPALPPPQYIKSRVLLIGTSTGGPQALTYLLKLLPADFPIPIAIVIHMPAGYTESFARRLNDESALKVIEAANDLLLSRGVAVIMPAGLHLKLVRTPEGFRARFDSEPLGRIHCPAVDVLFSSAAKGGDASDVLAVVMTGMGEDGLQGAGELFKAGARILTEAESSCVVYGMPRAVKEAGFSTAESTLESMAATIVRHL